MKLNKAHQNDSIYFLLALALIAGSGIGYSKLYLYHIVGIFTLLILFISKYRSEPEFGIKKSYLILCLFIFYNIAGFFWTLNKIYTLYQTVYIVIGFSIIILINKYIESERLRYLILPIIIGVSLGLLEGLDILRWPLSPYSESIENFGRSFKGGNLGKPITIPTSFFGNPNDLCLALNYLLCFVVFIRKRILKILSVLIIFFIISKTGSRGGQVTAIFVIFCYFIFFSKPFRIFCLLLFPIIGAGFFFIIRKVFFRFNIDYLLDFSYAGTQNSIGIRQQLFLNCINFLKESVRHLLLGAGGGASKQIHIIADNTFGIQNTHFFLLELLTEYGMIVFILIIFVYFISLIRLFKICRINRDNKAMTGAVFLALLTTIPGSISSSSIIYFFPFWIVLGFTIYYLQNYRNIRENTAAC